MRSPIRAIILLLATTAMSCPAPHQMLVAEGYTALVPPSGLFSVGSVISYEDEKDSDIAAKYRLLCGPRSSLGRDFLPTSVHAAGQFFNSSATSQWSLSGEALRNVTAAANTQSVQSITARIVNAKILSLSDSDVLENLQNRSKECRVAIAARLEQGHVVTMVSQAMIADVNYSVQWKSTTQMTGKARLKEMQLLSASLGGGQRRVGLRTIESRGLALGIKTDAFLLALGSDDGCEEERILAGRDALQGNDRPRVAAADAEGSHIVNPGGGYLLPEYIPGEE